MVSIFRHNSDTRIGMGRIYNRKLSNWASNHVQQLGNPALLISGHNGVVAKYLWVVVFHDHNYEEEDNGILT